MNIHIHICQYIYYIHVYIHIYLRELQIAVMGVFRRLINQVSLNFKTELY